MVIRGERDDCHVRRRAYYSMQRIFSEFVGIKGSPPTSSEVIATTPTPPSKQPIPTRCAAPHSHSPSSACDTDMSAFLACSMMHLTVLVSLALALVLVQIGPTTGTSLASQAHSHAQCAIVCLSDGDCADCPGGVPWACIGGVRFWSLLRSPRMRV